MTGILNLLMGTVRSAVVTDPYFEYTTLLLPGSGTNGTQNNSFVDSSANAFPITRNPLTGPNAPTQGTFSPFSQTGWGNYFDGTGDYLLTTSTQIIPSGSFTVEAWVYPTASTDAYAVAQGTTGNAGRFSLGITSNLWYVQIGSAAVNAGSVTLNQWTYLAATFNGTTLTLYVNGSSVGTAPTTTNAQNTTLRIGSLGPADWGTSYWTGYISNVRTSNTVRTVTTVPTSPYTNDGNTTFLSCQSNRFIDNSSNNFTITRNGDTRVVAFSPFNPSASWSAATYGGSGYFDGSGDYLSANSAGLELGSNLFTIDGWFYCTGYNGGGAIYSSVNTYPSSTGLLFYVNNVGTYTIDVNGSNVILSGTAPLNAWTHFAIVRSSTGANGVTLYINGSSIATGTSATNFSSTYAVIGRTGFGAASNYWLGYLSGIRVVVGSANVPSGVPTSPPTAITNTSLLLNFTNAGVYDATSKNDLETVGNAQISNAVTPQFGSTSIKFNGTTDYLSAPDSPLFSLGSANFTIECWFRSGSFASGQFFVSQWNSASYGYGFSIANSTTVKFEYYSSGVYTNRSYTVPTFSTNTWYHIAWVRYNGTTTVYIDGVARGTPTSDNVSITDSTRPLLIGINGDGNNQYFNGYIQDLRITPAIARYTTNFTPPTAAFPTL